MSYAIAYLGSLAFLAWLLWLWERRKETTGERIAFLTGKVAKFEVDLKDLPNLKATVDNLAMKSGLTPKR